jgi:hypothetical protein
MIMGDYDSDEQVQRNKKDEEAPKPTVDVLMSRNLRSGAGKGFNFGADMDDSSSDEEEVKEIIKPPPKGNRFGTLGKKLSLNVEEEEVKTVQKPPIVKKPGLNLKIDSE